MKNPLKRTIPSLLLSAFLLLTVLCSFSGCGGASADDAAVLRFRDATSIDELRRLNGRKITINGYMATSSPADGSFIFLMNLPYQSCPFCVPNTSQLSNTMEVYPKKGEKFTFSNQAISVTGTLVVADEGDAPFTDPYQYEFYYKIVDAEYRIINISELSGRLAIWQQVAEADLVNELYDMFNYVYFTVNWPEFFVESWIDENGDPQTGYYLYAEDAKHSITTDGAQYNYGYAEDYFGRLKRRFTKIDEKELSDVVEIIGRCEALSKKAVAALMNGEYTYEYKHVDKFGTDDYVYSLNDGSAMKSEYDELYYDFCLWIDSWEIG